MVPQDRVKNSASNEYYLLSVNSKIDGAMALERGVQRVENWSKRPNYLKIALIRLLIGFYPRNSKRSTR